MSRAFRIKLLVYFGSPVYLVYLFFQLDVLWDAMSNLTSDVNGKRGGGGERAIA